MATHQFISFNQLPLNPSQQFQMLQTLKQRGIITAEQARDPSKIQVSSYRNEDGHRTYNFNKPDGNAYMELTEVGKGKFSTLQYEHADNSVTAVIAGSAGVKVGETKTRPGYGGQAEAEIDLTKGTAKGGGSLSYGDGKVQGGGTIDLEGNTGTYSGGTGEGAATSTDLIKGNKNKDPLFGLEGKVKGSYADQTDKVSYGVLQPSGSLTEVQVQRDLGLVEGEAGARLSLADTKKFIKNLENGDLSKATDVAKGGASASVQGCLVKATNTISQRNAPEIDEDGNATITSFQGEANVCVGGGLGLKFKNGKLEGKLGPLGGGVGMQTESGDVSPEQKDFIEANEQGALSDTGDFLDSMKDLSAEGGSNALDGIGSGLSSAADFLGNVYDGTKQKISDGLDYLGDKANSLKDAIFGGDDDPTSLAVLDDLTGSSSTLKSLSSSSSGGQSIIDAEDEADTEADNADGHADRAENASRRARSAARRAAAAAARMRAMLSRRRAY
jgi:hypothetical protein